MNPQQPYRDLDNLIAQQIFGWKRTKHSYIHSLSYGTYYGQNHLGPHGNFPVMPPEFVEKTESHFHFDEPKMPKYSLDLDAALLVVHTLFPDDDAFELTIVKEVNEGFSGYHVKLEGIEVESEKTLAYVICLACLKLHELRQAANAFLPPNPLAGQKGS